MKVNIEYGENIIVAVLFNGIWKWYVTEKDYWFLDLIKLENAFSNDSNQVTEQDDFSDRFNIAVLNENTAKDFLDKIVDFQVSKDELRDVILQVEGKLNLEDYILELMPALLVDFDNKILLSCFPEPASFESFTPDGWVGKYEDFLDKVPTEEKYWIINNKNYFRFDNGKGVE
ncbi:hypothetical protein [Paenibacillus sp. Leaf72]|uniref:hypothetical protein n=1 Tax=Paenibacillus sp. Leaf72 TaxID=1736234 RepID=UPI0006F42128|nr:hypothetical protein [Paenibacillus sp. Leaf72]KQO02797.1 hypothetical protein ASF12_33120 [Paenibacillus sp. Leaf72]